MNLIFKYLFPLAALFSQIVVCHSAYATNRDDITGIPERHNIPSGKLVIPDSIPRSEIQNYISKIFETSNLNNRNTSMYDTLVYDLANALKNGSSINFPIFTRSSNVIYSVDFAIKFKQANITFDTLISLEPSINYLYYFNPNDSILRLTSYSLNPIISETKLFNVIVSSMNNELCLSDFQNSQVYLNGDFAANKITDCVINTAISEPNETAPAIKLFPNPANNYFILENGNFSRIDITDIHGKLVLTRMHANSQILVHFDVDMLAPGPYLVKLYHAGSVSAHKLLIIRPDY
ncbi:MAG: T9SS type A sorting domain-containing protein [Bacteroidetes bacterium]|nr:T9SS type A sorting domain-containing protein [Bacteroidota bacterium]